MKQKILEARLDRSLENQVGVPRLDRKFNAAVWAKIAAEEAKAAKPRVVREPSRATRASRWFAIINTVGAAVTLGIVAYFVLRTTGGIAVEVPQVAVPVLSEDLVSQYIGVAGHVLGLAALAFGFSLTSAGRRLRASFS